MTLPDLIIAIAAVVLALQGAAYADEYQPDVALHAMSFAAGVLQPHERDAKRSLTIDSARAATLIIASTEPLDFRVKLPDGSILTSERDGGDQSHWYRFDNTGQSAGDILPGVGSRANLLLTISKPPAGRYDVDLVRTGESKKDIPFVITFLLDSDLGMALWMPSGQALQGEPFLLSAILLDGRQRGLGAQIRATLLKDPEDGASQAVRLGEFALHDDGAHGDLRAQDGVYTAAVVPKDLGRIRIGIRGTGTSRAGLAFERDLGTEILVSRRSVRIRRLGSARSDLRPTGTRGGINVPLELEGPSGRYEVAVELHAANGARVAETKIVELKRRANIAIAFPQKRLKLFGTARTTATSIEVYELTDGDKILRGRLFVRN